MKCNIICKFAPGKKICSLMDIVDSSNVSRLDSMLRPGLKVTFVAHVHPDGDAAGSTLALREIIENRGCDAVVIYPEPLPVSLLFLTRDVPADRVLSYSDNRTEAQARILSSDMIFCVDCNSFSRTGDAEAELRASKAFKVLVDHHLSPDTETFGLVFSTTRVSSACELVYHIVMEFPEIGGNPANLPGKASVALMTGMTTDTNNFANSVFPSTFVMASGLLDAGVDRNVILDELYSSWRENRIRLEGYLLHDNMKITPEGVAYMVVDNSIAAEYDIREGETEGFVNMPLAIGRVKMSIFLKQDGDGFFRVSVRSKKGYSANKCAVTYFHGGGHENASGGRLFFSDVSGHKADIQSPGHVEEYLQKVAEDFFSSEGYGR